MNIMPYNFDMYVKDMIDAFPSIEKSTLDVAWIF